MYINTRNIRKRLNEGWFDKTATPHHSKGDARREIGVNPLRTDIGGHSSGEELRQPSTFDRNGENFKSKLVVLSDNKFMFYKVKNFGNPDVKSTLSFFGDEKELRKTIDTINGAADRNGKSVSYRAITGEGNKEKAERTENMVGCFWEFSVDGGNEWYILKPNCIQNMTQSKLLLKP